jgi:hypothetical protein
LEDLRVDGRIILKSILEYRVVSVWIRIGTKAGYCSHDNEPAGFVKFGEFLDYLRKNNFSKKDSTSWIYLIELS